MNYMQGFSHSAPSMALHRTVELPNEIAMMTMKVPLIHNRRNGVLAADCCKTDSILLLTYPDFKRPVLRLLS